jgi:hypothetical protein
MDILFQDLKSILMVLEAAAAVAILVIQEVTV